MAKLMLEFGSLFYKHEPVETPSRPVTIEVELDGDRSPTLMFITSADDGPVLHINGYDEIDALRKFCEWALASTDRNEAE